MKSSGDRADEIGQEDERALEHRDDVQVVREVAPDLERHFGDALLNLFLR
jgi:hypothetical protein